MRISDWSSDVCSSDLSIGSSRSPEGCCWWPSTRQSTAGRRGMIVNAIEEGVHTVTAMRLPSPPPEWAQFTLGPLTIHTYALCLIAGMIAATVYTQRRLSGRGAEKGVVLDIVLWAIPLGIVGARFYHVLTHGADYFYPGANIWAVFAHWAGGRSEWRR